MTFLASKMQFGYGLNVLGNGTYIYNRNDERIGFGFTAGFNVVYEGVSYKEWGRLYIDTNQNGIYEGTHLYDQSSGIIPSQIGIGGEGIDHHYGYYYSINYTSDRDNVVDVWSRGVSGFSGLDGYGIIEITSELSFDTTKNDNFMIGTTNDDRILGIKGNDTFLGKSGNDQINGGRGYDYLNGGNGNDVLNGGIGKDHLIGGYGNDKLIGGLGIDTAVFSSRNNTVNLGRRSRQNTGDGRDILTGIENVNGGGGDDTIRGDSGANTFRGENGVDKLYGNAGDDRLYGGSGDDILKGSSGVDRLTGGSGDDTLYGGSGNNVLTGGRGEDIFHINTGTGRDLIKDFTDGDDRIKLLTGKSDVNLIQFGNHVKVKYEGDLMAIIENMTTGELDQSGSFLS